MTEYSIAWNKYLMSNDYIHSQQEMAAKGIKQPYLNNILELTFQAGYNSKAAALAGREEEKKVWYIKLLAKLLRIKHGTHLTLDEYIEEVKLKIKPLPPPPKHEGR